MGDPPRSILAIPVPRLGWCRLRPFRYAGCGEQGNVEGGKVASQNIVAARYRSTEPSAAPKFSAELGERAAESVCREDQDSRLRRPLPAMAARRSVRLATPAYSTYIMQDSIENHKLGCARLLTSVSAVSVPRRPIRASRAVHCRCLLLRRAGSAAASVRGRAAGALQPLGALLNAAGTAHHDGSPFHQEQLGDDRGPGPAYRPRILVISRVCPSTGQQPQPVPPPFARASSCRTCRPPGCGVGVCLRSWAPVAEAAELGSRRCARGCQRRSCKACGFPPLHQPGQISCGRGDGHRPGGVVSRWRAVPGIGRRFLRVAPHEHARAIHRRSHSAAWRPADRPPGAAGCALPGRNSSHAVTWCPQRAVTAHRAVSPLGSHDPCQQRPAGR